MKDIKHLEKDLEQLLGGYMDTEQADLKADDYPNEHDFFNILNSCEELINRINEVEKWK